MIEVRNLSYRYPGQADPAVKDLNFRIPEGTIFGFLGPSGAGKSTTQKILMNLLTDYSGEILIDGKELSSLGKKYNERIGVAFEFPYFYNRMSALENLNFFAGLYNTNGESPEVLLEKTGLLEHASKKTDEFSKGMKMRLNFCRAMLNNPDIIYLDEPTSGLDPVHSRNIRNLIMTEKEKGKTIFLTTHIMEVADQLCDQIAFIARGELAAIDTPENFRLKHGKKTVKIELKGNEKKESKIFPLENIGTNKEFLQIIKEKEILTLHSQEAGMEDVFIKLTGQRLS